MDLEARRRWWSTAVHWCKYEFSGVEIESNLWTLSWGKCFSTPENAPRLEVIEVLWRCTSRSPVHRASGSRINFSILFLFDLGVFLTKRTKKLMSKYKGQLFWQRGLKSWCQNIRDNKIGQGPPSPLFRQCLKEIDFFPGRCSLILLSKIFIQYHITLHIDQGTLSKVHRFISSSEIVSTQTRVTSFKS